jgi:O-antigen/teichoic acid export membrane protein
VLYFGATLYFGLIAKIPSDLVREIELSIPWLIAVVPVVLANGLLVGAMKGRERFAEVNLVSSASSVLMAILPLCAALLFSPRLDLLIAMSLLARAGAVIVQFFQVRKAIPLGPVQPPRRHMARSLLSFGGWVSATSLLTPLLASFDRLAIGSMLGAAAVSLYAIPYNLASRTTMLSASLGSALLPRFAAIDESQREALEREGIAVIATALTPLMIGAMFVMGPFLRLWIGDTLGARAEPIAIIFLVGWWANAFAVVALTRIQGSGRPDIVTKLLLAQLPFYFAALWAAMHWWGLMGAAVAWTLRAIVDPLVLLALNRQLRHTAPRLLLNGALVCAAAAAAVLLDYQNPTRWGLLAATLLLGLAASWITAPARLIELRRRFVQQAQRGLSRCSALLGHRSGPK